MHWAIEHLSSPAIAMVCVWLIIEPFRRAFRRWTGNVDRKVSFAIIVLVANAATLVEENWRDVDIWVVTVVMLTSAFYLVRRAARAMPTASPTPVHEPTSFSRQPSASPPS